MDFSQTDLQKFLQAAVKVRFGDIQHADFRLFMEKMFRDNGYLTRPVESIADFTGDIILEKENIKTAVLLRKYPENKRVGVQDVNAAIVAGRSVQADQTMIVTTSSLTSAAVDLSRQASLFVWDWPMLREAIDRTYAPAEGWMFGTAEEVSETEDDYFEWRVTEVSPDQYPGEENIPFTKILLSLRNTSGKNVQTFLDLPVLIRHDKKQHTAEFWLESGFQSGVIYNGAAVEVGCYFQEKHLPELQRGDRLLIPVSAPSLNLLKTYPLELLEQDERCFIVTFAFYRGSPEYQEAVLFRDRYLLQRKWGRRMVKNYYRLSPPIVRFFSRFRWSPVVFRPLVRGILICIRPVLRKR